MLQYNYTLTFSSLLDKERVHRLLFEVQTNVTPHALSIA